MKRTLLAVLTLLMTTSVLADVEVDMILNNSGFSSFDHFWAKIELNNLGEVNEGSQIYGILEVLGEYYFYPSFSEELDFETVVLPPGLTYFTLLEFDFPDIEELLPFGPLYFWGAFFVNMENYGYDRVEFWLDYSHQWTPTPSPSLTPTHTPTPSPTNTFTPTPVAWEVHVIDTWGTAGEQNSLALDDEDKPHISYWRALGSEGMLMYARLVESEWQIETVDPDGGFGNSISIDSDGRVHIAYFKEDYVMYVKQSEEGWESTIIDDRFFCSYGISLATDLYGCAHVAYYGGDEVNDRFLKYALIDDFGCSVETVDNQGEVGMYCALALDMNDFPRISYTDLTNSDLKHAKYSGSSWEVEIVESYGSAGIYSSIAIDLNNFSHVSYLDQNTFCLKYATQHSTGWTYQTVDPTLKVGYWTSLKLDEYDRACISYGWSNSYNNDMDLKYAYQSDDGWTLYDVDSDGFVGYCTSLELSHDGFARISYGAEGIRYAVQKLR